MILKWLTMEQLKFTQWRKQTICGANGHLACIQFAFINQLNMVDIIMLNANILWLKLDQPDAKVALRVPRPIKCLSFVIHLMTNEI